MHEGSGVVEKNKKCFILETRNRRIIWPVGGCAKKITGSTGKR